jgi:hypothetical protein
MAAEALEGWLEVHLVGGEVPPRSRFVGSATTKPKRDATHA